MERVNNGDTEEEGERETEGRWERVRSSSMYKRRLVGGSTGDLIFTIGDHDTINCKMCPKTIALQDEKKVVLCLPGVGVVDLALVEELLGSNSPHRHGEQGHVK